MPGVYETADNGPRSLGVFPAEWGIPVGSKLSEERAAWVRLHVREHMARKGTLSRVEDLGAERVRHLRDRLILRKARWERESGRT